MIDTDKYEGHMHVLCALANSKVLEQSPYHVEILLHDSKKYMRELLAEVKRLREEVKVLSKYRDIVEKYDDALLGDGDTDPRWSELFD